MRPCPLVAPRTLNAVDGRLTRHTAPLHGMSHQITGPKAAPCRPGATIARLSNVVCKSGTIPSRSPPNNSIATQFRVLRLGLLQDGNVGVGVFPEGEEIFISGACLRGPLRQGYQSAVLEIESVDFLLALIDHEQRRIIRQKAYPTRPVTS